MASIRKFKNSANWYACYTLPDGKRKQVSTGLSDKEQALEIALKWERAARGAKAKGTFTERQARRVLQEIALSVGTTAFSEETVREFFKRHQKTPRQEAKRTTQRREATLAGFLDELADKADEPIEFVETRDVKRWIAKQQERGLALSSVNDLLAYVSRAFKDAQSEGLIASNPCDGCRLRGAKKAAAKRKHYSLEQFQALVEKTDGEWQTLILLAALTGQRQKDCSRLKWGQVDFKRGIITFKRQKNKDEFPVPMVPILAKHLQGIFKQAPKEYIMPEMANRPATGRLAISDVFRNEILPLIGIKQAYGKLKGAGRQVAEYSFHSLRHSCSTWLADSGVAESDRMAFIGHEDEAVSRGYTHATSEQVQRALDKFSTYLEGKAQ